MASVIYLATSYPNAQAPLDRLVFAQDNCGAMCGVVLTGWAHEAGCAEVGVVA